MRKVLLIAFEFPPANAISALRLGKFARYLPDFGWQPVVLTSAFGQCPGQALPGELQKIDVVRVPYFAPSSAVYGRLGGDEHLTPVSSGWTHGLRQAAKGVLKLARPFYNSSILRPLLYDPIGWYSPALRKGKEILKEQAVDAIFSTYGPSTPHLVASKLQKQSRLPWVAEFRDLWALNHNNRTSAPVRFMECRIEKRVMRHSSRMITVSTPLAEQLRALHGKNVSVITNGFDEEDYQESVPLNSKFTITYTGNIYPGKQDPSLLFTAIAELKQEGKISADNFQVLFFGNNVSFIVLPLIEKYQIGDLVKICGLVPFREVIRQQKEATVLLVLSWNDPGYKGVYTGKVFEYLGAGRPILSVGLKGSVIDDLLTETGSGVAADNALEIKAILSNWLDEFRERKSPFSHYSPRVEVIRQYTRREQTGKLAQLLDEVSQGF